MDIEKLQQFRKEIFKDLFNKIKSINNFAKINYEAMDIFFPIGSIQNINLIIKFSSPEDSNTYKIINHKMKEIFRISDGSRAYYEKIKEISAKYDIQRPIYRINMSTQEKNLYKEKNEAITFELNNEIKQLEQPKDIECINLIENDLLEILRKLNNSFNSLEDKNKIKELKK